ncbi:tetratricopeptide repeat protein [Treponema brennaborense]|uniref:Tetratricopeptide TPR_1 repeat-containing protein n=1 Tax=Treponema brennaborense (strain DSM 12168 / CIP 105900 / DD5/3) TaxID=906968 RepID=F4LQF7_TREBD|nr:tetratricopeptide repeat protein [Treponema brennaborense]AEE17166.1 Tetratricopeptide TPR_1 repeat-containing protein [Treponema brennaborense DSM 12168]
MSGKLRAVFYSVCVILIAGTLPPAFAQQKADALQLYTSGKYAEAIQVCESELAENPNNLDSYTVLCWSLVKNRQYAEAEQRAGDGLKVNQYDHRLIEVLGEAKFYLGKNNEALSLFEEYISYVPANGSRIGTAYYFMGEIYIRQAKYQHADIALTAAVRSEPLLDYWWTRLGYAREMAGNYRASITAYDKALLLNPSQADARRGRDRVQASL